MKNVSKRYKEKIQKNREFLYKVEIYFTDGRNLVLTDPDDLMHDGIKIEKATSGTNSFDIGAAIIGELTLRLNNKTKKFSLYDFFDATLYIWIGLRIDEETVEYLYMGKYTVDDAITPGTTVVISALDEMCRFERDYKNVTTVYPATLLQIVQDLCVYCAIPSPARFDNCNYVINTRPEDEVLTCLGMVSFVAQIAGCYAVINEGNGLEYKWYDTIFDEMENLDGGQFSIESFKDSVDGGDFKNYNTGIVLDGGDFNQQKRYAHIYTLGSMTVSTDEITITGVRVKATKGEGTEETESYLYGEEGYVLSIEGNPLILMGQESIISQHVGNKVIGMKVRTFDVSALSDPSTEAGDCAYITDRLGNSYPVYITSTSFHLSNYQKFSCGAESPSRKRARSMSALTKAIIASRKIIEQKITAYDVAVQRLTELMSNSFGVYKTDEKQEDGSTIFYMHDKPTVGESKIIWKMTSGAIAVSTDGGKTWNAGMDASGNMVVTVLSAIGINADWINAGSLVLGGLQTNKDGSIKVYDSYGAEIGHWNKTGLQALAGYIGGFSIEKEYLYSGNKKDYEWETGDTGSKLSREGIGFVGNNTIIRLGVSENRVFRGLFIQEVINGINQWVTIQGGSIRANAPDNINGGYHLGIGDDSCGCLAILNRDRNTIYLNGADGSVRADKLQSMGVTQAIGGLIVGWTMESGEYLGANIDQNGNANFKGNGKFEGKLTVEGKINSKATFDNAVTNSPNVYITTNFNLARNTSSSRRYKHDIKKIGIEEVKKLYNLPVCEFKYNEGYINNDDERYSKDVPGIIVEDLEEILPIAVNHENGIPEMWNSNIMIPCMLKLIQDLNNRVLELEKRILD